MHGCIPRFAIISLAAATLVLAGCESILKTSATGDQGTPEEERHRLNYQTDRDPDSMRWLLRHRIRQGMSLAEVNLVLGEDGLREKDDRWIKNDGGVYRQDDDVYKWGPDGNGRTVYLVFRDDCLTNYDPLQFASPEFDNE